MTIGEALQRFSQQTQTSIRTLPALQDTTIQLDVAEAPFWPALDRIAQLSRTRVDFYSASGELTLVKASSQAPRNAPLISYSGIFRTSLQRLTSSHDFDLDTRSLRATLEVAWEPHFVPYFLETRPRQLRMVGADGKEVPIASDSSSWVPIEGRRALTLDVTLPAPPRSAQQLPSLQGTLTMRGATRMVTCEFGNLADLVQQKSAKMSKDGVSVFISDLKLRPRFWSVKVEAELPQGTADFESYQFWDVNNRLVLVSKDGKLRLESSGYNRLRSSSRKATLEYLFEDGAAIKRGEASQWQLSYLLPASIVELPIPFQFKQVPLP